MALTQKLIYGGHEIRLRDDADLPAIRERIEDALNGKHSRWIEIETDRGPKWVLVNIGVSIRLETNQNGSGGNYVFG